MFAHDIAALAAGIVQAAERRAVTLATAESCTGGLIAAALTAVPGSAAAVECGFVTYSNGAKSTLIGVPGELIERDGAVSESVARAMASGALRHSSADVAVSVTGIAGPSGGSEDKPVGLVHFAAASPQGVVHAERRFGDIGRENVRMASVRQALAMLSERIESL
jgi:nicotinamide-nucleotide amidase